MAFPRTSRFKLVSRSDHETLSGVVLTSAKWFGMRTDAPIDFERATIVAWREFKAGATGVRHELKRAVRFRQSITDHLNALWIDAIDGDPNIGNGLVVKTKNALGSLFDRAFPASRDHRGDERRRDKTKCVKNPATVHDLALDLGVLGVSSDGQSGASTARKTFRPNTEKLYS